MNSPTDKDLESYRNAGLEMMANVLGVKLNQLNQSRQDKKCMLCECELDLYPYFCNQHGPHQYEMEVKPSTIDGAGLGLFTCIDLEIDDYIAPYNGDVINPSSVDLQSRYALLVPANLHDGIEFVIDPTERHSSLGRYANDARDKAKQNAQFSFQPTPQGYMVPVIKSISIIPKGSEIFIDYGEHYWSKFCL